MRKITREELGLCNGRNGAPAYIAYNGLVYDVSGCFLWKGGRHQAMHDAGRDLTEALKEAPHGQNLLERAVLIGELSDR